jgi:hypothetical protein
MRQFTPEGNWVRRDNSVFAHQALSRITGLRFIIAGCPAVTFGHRLPLKESSERKRR